MPDVSLLTFNAHAGMRPRPIALPRLRDPSGRRAREPYDLPRVLCDLAADVMVVQESYRPDGGVSAVDRAAHDLGMELHEIEFGRAVLEPWPHLLEPGTGTKGVAVLTRLPVRRLPDIPIVRVPTDPSPHRHALHLEVDVDGRALELVALHLTSRLPHGPPVQLLRLRRWLPSPDRVAVVTGDFNLWGPPVSALLPGWRRVVRGRTWPAHRPHSQIDHVLVGDDVEVVDAAVLPNVGSDHRPVRATLRLR